MLNIECRKFLKDNERNWLEHREEMEKLEIETMRQEKLRKARGKKAKSQENQEIKDKNRKITEMLEKIPTVEADRIEKE